MKKKVNKTTKKYLKKVAKRELNKQDKEWSIAVKKDFDFKCLVCGSTKMLNAHHIVPRESLSFRHLVVNGLALCPKHHKFSRDFSAHKNPLVFYLFYKKKYAKRYDLLLKIIKEGGILNGRTNNNE